jgi:MFS family permease
MFFVGSLVPTFFLDKMGRRRPMMWGSLGLAISMMMLSVLLSFSFKPQYSESLAKKTSEASIAFFFTYMLIFGATANCIPWVYVRVSKAGDYVDSADIVIQVPEILPLHARAKGTSIGKSNRWVQPL